LGITYDTGALIAADREERHMWAQHRALLALREGPTVPAPVVAQSWRDGALPARLLAGCDVDALDDRQARSVGSLAARTVTGDIVDAGVVEGARLLTPAGDFRPVLRMYQPAPEVLNQTCTVPPIARS
jgi:hypothetical protein